MNFGLPFFTRIILRDRAIKLMYHTDLFGRQIVGCRYR